MYEFIPCYQIRVKKRKLYIFHGMSVRFNTLANLLCNYAIDIKKEKNVTILIFVGEALIKFNIHS